MQGGAGRLALELGQGRAVGSLAGPGLSIVVEDGASVPQLSVQAEGPGQILAEGPARLLPDGILDAHARLEVTSEAVKLDAIRANLGGMAASGVLTLPREGRYTGRIAIPSVDLRQLIAASLGPAPSSPGSIWSTARFGRVAGLPDIDIAVEAGSLAAFDGGTIRNASFALRSDQDGLRVDDIRGAFGGGQLAGRLSLRRDGGLAQLNGRLSVMAIDLGDLTKGAVGGKASGQIEFGGSGETPARLIAGLSGAGSLALSETRLARFDPNAYARVIASTGEDASESDASRLQDRIAAALDRDAWALSDVALPFTLAGGLVRLQPFSFERNGLRAEASGVVDLRALTADLRLGLKPLGAVAEGLAGRCAADRDRLARAALEPAARERCQRSVEHRGGAGAGARDRACRSLRGRCARARDACPPAAGRARDARERAQAQRVREGRGRAPPGRGEAAGRGASSRGAASQAEEKRAEDVHRVEQARAEVEARRRADAEERARAAAERAAAQSAPPQPQPGPLVLPGAPREQLPRKVRSNLRPAGRLHNCRRLSRSRRCRSPATCRRIEIPIQPLGRLIQDFSTSI